MEQELVAVLKDIRGVLYVLVALVAFATAVWVINGLATIARNLTAALQGYFSQVASSYYEAANYQKLVSHCHRKLRTHPNHATAIWWLARAELQLGRLEEAKVLFDKVSVLEPTWRQTHVEPFQEFLPRG
ncbi:tetratricopeptide repeat protein [Hydrogenophaga sp. 5NK40-0174]|uniref:tetratricopeptide repeat protein n=1 Tax=Hydrogenophaga sp. 5NK40-0174 TaxID=3127649 RepID=UPI003105E71E